MDVTENYLVSRKSTTTKQSNLNKDYLSRREAENAPKQLKIDVQSSVSETKAYFWHDCSLIHINLSDKTIN